MSVLDEIRKLDEKKAQLLETAKKEALDSANAALKTLRDLGFNYRITMEDRPVPIPGERRTGQRDAVLATVKTHGPISSADVLTKMGATNDADRTSIRNALSALKRKNKIDQVNGNYVVKG